MMRNNSVLFRADANAEIGAGHVMRCLTLADALAERGWQAAFACRDLPDNLALLIQVHGHVLHKLPLGFDASNSGLAHAPWLRAGMREDLAQVRQLIAAMPAAPNWIVVDHYALDARWETPLRASGARVLVIDDLADRAHDCDVLLDQNLDRDPADYRWRTPAPCRLLCGPHYALLRPEFAQLRLESLARRQPSQRLQHLLISLGAGDHSTVCLAILEALATLPNTGLPFVRIIKGEHVRLPDRSWPFPLESFGFVEDMGHHLLWADLAIGAAGSSIWERACLGLPSILLPLAENQRASTRILAEKNMAIPLLPEDIPTHLPAIIRRLLAPNPLLHAMGATSSAIVDGAGCRRVADAMLTMA